MSIEIELIGQVPGAMFNKRAPKLALDAIHEWIDKNFPLTIWGRHPSESTYAVDLHPLHDPVKFEIVGKTILLKATTSPIGPGYHATVIDLTDKLSAATHVKWKEDEKHKDSSGYFGNRDFAKLQNHFTRWLRHLCTTIQARAQVSNESNQMFKPEIKLNFEGYALSPLGPRTKEWVASVAAGGTTGEDFWIWPELEVTSDFYARYALAIMWNLIDWHPAQTNRQKTIMLIAHESLHRAFSLDPENPLIPWQAWKELCDFTMQQFPATAPRPLPHGERIGYMRHHSEQIEA